jgi:hypothetical protein
MKRIATRRIGWMLLLCLAALPGVVTAGYFCYSAGPGCTRCDNYSPEGEYQGWVVACQ